MQILLLLQKFKICGCHCNLSLLSASVILIDLKKQRLAIYGQAQYYSYKQCMIYWLLYIVVALFSPRPNVKSHAGGL